MTRYRHNFSLKTAKDLSTTPLSSSLRTGRVLFIVADYVFIPILAKVRTLKKKKYLLWNSNLSYQIWILTVDVHSKQLFLILISFNDVKFQNVAIHVIRYTGPCFEKKRKSNRNGILFVSLGNVFGPSENYLISLLEDAGLYQPL